MVECSTILTSSNDGSLPTSANGLKKQEILINNNHNNNSPTMISSNIVQDTICNKKMENNSNESTHKAQHEKSSQKATRLANFYENKTVLMTGVTGFIGKVCLLKLMHSLESCERVYVMLRPKKGMSPQQRFMKLLSEEPFAPAPTENPNGCPEWETAENKGISPKELKSIMWHRVIAVEGDMSKEDLGFSDEVKETLCKDVDIIFNIAASVQFDAPLKQNLRDNYLGCKNLLQLATKFERLISYVHVSTFYVNSHKSQIEEHVLPLERDCYELADLISGLSDAELEKTSEHLMENRPNTYIITKAMAENLVMKYQGKLPLAILRPSIVMPSVAEPYPGWVDNVNGPMGLGVLASLGILRNIDWNYDGVADLIPVDYVANSMLAVAERTARLNAAAQKDNGKNNKEIIVYNCSSSSLKPISWGQTFEHLRATSMKCPPYKMLRMPIKPPKHERASKLGWFISTTSEFMFAFFIDFLLFIFGQKPILRKLTAKLHHAYEILKPFTTTAYTCTNDNLLAAYEELTEEDKQEFQFQPETIDWGDMLNHAVYGIRRRLLNDDPANIPAATRKMRVHMVVEFVFKIFVYLLVAGFIYKLFGQLTPAISYFQDQSSSSSVISSASAYHSQKQIVTNY